MTSIKASFLDSLAASQNQACLRFDYSGHGFSDGDFEAARIGDWLAESLLIFLTQSTGPQIIIGSSMGGWIALLLARALAASAETARLAGMVLIAPATDFTEKLIWDGLSAGMQTQLISKGCVLLPSAYRAEPIKITRGLIEEGRNHLLFGAPIRSHCPVHILHGMQDKDVPWRHAMTLAEHMGEDNVVLTLIKDGDHRLSRPEDLERLGKVIRAIC
jgi:pimeloyl-ACP methyl ester carboxylesterase